MHTLVYSSDFSAAKMMLSIHVIACCFPHADPLKLIPQGEEDVSVMRWCSPPIAAQGKYARGREAMRTTKTAPHPTKSTSPLPLFTERCHIQQTYNDGNNKG